MEACLDMIPNCAGLLAEASLNSVVSVELSDKSMPRSPSPVLHSAKKASRSFVLSMLKNRSSAGAVPLGGGGPATLLSEITPDSTQLKRKNWVANEPVHAKIQSPPARKSPRLLAACGHHEDHQEVAREATTDVITCHADLQAVLCTGRLSEQQANAVRWVMHCVAMDAATLKKLSAKKREQVQGIRAAALRKHEEAAAVLDHAPCASASS